MPEAAEVTVAARQFALVAVPRVVQAIDVTHPRTTRHTDPSGIRAMVGRRIVGVTAHGKWIVCETATGPPVGIHLRMSGQLLAVEAGTPHPDRHVHATLRLGPRENGIDPAAAHDSGVPAPPPGAPGAGPGPFDLWFRDPRTFGEMRTLDGKMPVVEDLRDLTVTAELLRERARRRRVGIKAVLLDQTRTVAGIGSYLADEALHAAGIAPTRPGATLTIADWERILTEARALVATSAAAGGVTLADEGWVDLWGRPGHAAELLRVHARDRCGTCGAPTMTAVVGGRRARWCRSCQPARRRRA